MQKLLEVRKVGEIWLDCDICWRVQWKEIIYIFSFHFSMNCNRQSCILRSILLKVNMMEKWEISQNEQFQFVYSSIKCWQKESLRTKKEFWSGLQWMRSAIWKDNFHWVVFIAVLNWNMNADGSFWRVFGWKGSRFSCIFFCLEQLCCEFVGGEIFEVVRIILILI